MKIAFVAHNFVRGNGQGRINYEIVRHALRFGHSLTLLADQVTPELLDLGATQIRIRQRPRRPNLLGVFTFAAFADQVIERIRRDVDVVVGAGFTLRRRHDVNLCQFVHGAWIRSPVHVARLRGGWYGQYQSLFTRRNALWEKQAYDAADVVVAPSNKIRDELVSIGVPSENIRIVYNGVDLDEFCPGTADRTSLGLPQSVPLALFCGDIRTPRKNLDSVLRALTVTPQVHLAVVGSVEGSPFPEMATRLRIADRVHFAGYRTDVNRFMRACDLFVFPSRYEAGTLVLIEALASGMPVVTARTAGGCEIMPSAAGVILDDPDDIPGLQKAIQRFSADPILRSAASRAAREAAEQHSWLSMSEHYMDIFDAALHLKRTWANSLPALAECAP
jgi:glycosyltransferase involved in cell wall biosynthesis